MNKILGKQWEIKYDSSQGPYRVLKKKKHGKRKQQYTMRSASVEVCTSCCETSGGKWRIGKSGRRGEAWVEAVSRKIFYWMEKKKRSSGGRNNLSKHKERWEKFFFPHLCNTAHSPSSYFLKEELICSETFTDSPVSSGQIENFLISNSLSSCPSYYYALGLGNTNLVTLEL
jgi:hypothetical protein